MLGLPDPLVTAREAGIFRSYKINGVPAFSILVIPALTTVLHTAVVTIIITATAPLLFDAPSPVNWPIFVLTFLLTAFACAGLAVLIGVVSPSSRMTVLWSQLIILLASGVLAFGLAIYLFNWDRRNSTRRGHPLLALLALLPSAIGVLLLS